MAGVNAISSVGATIRPSGIARSSPGKIGGGDFAEMFKDMIGKVNQKQDSAAAAVSDLVSGKNRDILPVVMAVADADLSFKLLVGVRNKVIEAYKQTMNMQV